MAESRLLVVARDWGSIVPGIPRRGMVLPNGVAPSEMAAAFLGDVCETARSLHPKSSIRAVVEQPSGESQSTGDRLARIFADGFSAGADSICVIGTSAPHLPAAYILEAFGRLTQHPDSIVLGPADSGRLYLIGVSRSNPCPLLKEILWEKTNVLRETLQRAVESELSVSLLPSLEMIEAADSFRRLSRDLRRGVAVAPQTQNIVRKLRLE